MVGDSIMGRGGGGRGFENQPLGMSLNTYPYLSADHNQSSNSTIVGQQE